MVSNENAKMMVECEDCKEKFTIDKDNVTFKKEFKLNEQSIFITYYDCPRCGRRHYVQIDDSVSLEKLEEVQRQFVSLSVLRRRGKKVSKKRSDKFKESRMSLNEYRNALMKEYAGKLLHDDETDKDFKLRFSV